MRVLLEQQTQGLANAASGTEHSHLLAASGGGEATGGGSSETGECHGENETIKSYQIKLSD